MCIRDRAGAEDVEILTFDGAEDFEAAAREEVEIEGEFAIDHADEGHAGAEHFARGVDFAAHEFAELGREARFGDHGFVDAETVHIFAGNVDAVLRVVDADILPEIGKLQGGAGLVGEGEALFVAITAGVEDDAADGIRGVVARCV